MSTAHRYSTTSATAIVADPECGDHALYLDGSLVGFARTAHEAQTMLDQLAHERHPDSSSAIPLPPRDAIAEALAFHQSIGVERKAARLRYLTDRWVKQVETTPRVKILSSRQMDQAWGLANVSLDGVDVSKAYDFLWEKYRIITAAIKHAEYQGLRVTPNVYTTLEEVDTFAAAIKDLLKQPPSTAA